MSTQVSTRFSLREVAELTGLSEFTLRGWEGRYRAVNPQRTETGRRLYGAEDVTKLNLLKDLVTLGHRIKEIAPLKEAELRELLSAPDSNPSGTHALQSNVENLFIQGERFSWDEIRRILGRERKKSTPEKYLTRFLIPFLVEMNRRIGQGRISISLEHIFSSLIKEELATLRSLARGSTRSRPAHRFVLCTPEGDHHELGLLFAFTLLSLRGIPSLYLGPHVPKQELCETALRYQATHILVSSTLKQGEGPVDAPLKYLGFIHRHLPRLSSLWIAGRGFHEVSDPSGARFQQFHNFEAFISELDRLK
jgi:DNA-binding transcriptional MerR regulator